MSLNAGLGGTAVVTRHDYPARLGQLDLTVTLDGFDPADSRCSGRHGDIEAGPRLELTTPRIDSEMPCPTCGHVLIFDEVWGWMHTVRLGVLRCALPKPQLNPVVRGQ